MQKNMNWFATVLIVVICFIILTDLTEFSVEVLCDWSFQVLGEITMDEGIRSGKSVILEIPEAPQGKDSQATKLEDAPEGIPSFF